MSKRGIPKKAMWQEENLAGKGKQKDPGEPARKKSFQPEVESRDRPAPLRKRGKKERRGKTRGKA